VIIEDLGFNFIERQVLLADFTIQRNRFDYGYDGVIQTFRENGETENGEIVILILYDSAKNTAFFVDIQDYFRSNAIEINNVRKFVRIYIPQTGLFTSYSVKNLRIKKNLNYGIR
jgi:hypothetical protein